jgi:hypothetical protein
MAATNPIRVVYAASATGAQEALSIDWRDQVPSGYSFEVQFNSGASGSVTIESTLDDINDSTITPDWITETVAITADTRGIIAHPVTAVRVNIGSLAGGTLTFKLLGGSLIGDVTGLVAPGGGGGPSSNVNLVATGGNTLAVDDAAAGTTAPVPVGGIHLTTSPAYTNGDRTQWQSGAAGLLMNSIGRRGTYSDTISNGNIVWPFGFDDGRAVGGSALAVAQTVFNGTTWDRQRGTTLGTYAIGPDADDAAASAGANPVPVGGIYNAIRPSYTAGDRAQLQFGSRGSVAVEIFGSNSSNTPPVAAPADTLSSATTGLTVTALLEAYNGASFDRIRLAGAALGLLVESGPYVAGRVTADGQIKGSAGFIHTITISPNGSVAAGVLTIYNSLTETGTIVAQFALPVTTFTPFSVTLDVACGTGIYVGFDATLANVSCTVSYR